MKFSASQVGDEQIQVVRVPSSDPRASVWRLKSPYPTCSLENEVSTVDQFVRKIFARHAKRPALGYRKILAKQVTRTENDATVEKMELADEYTWFTHEQVDEMIENASHGLLQIGLKRGDVVALLMASRCEWLIACHAVLRMGATVASLNANLSAESTEIALNELKPTHVITSSDLLEKIYTANCKSRVVSTVIVVDNTINAEAERWPIESSDSCKLVSFSSLVQGHYGRSVDGYEAPEADSSAVIIHTSGSTGEPKGVLYSHRDLLAGIYVLARSTINSYEQLKSDNEGAFLSFLPLAHVLQFIFDHVMLNFGLSVGYSTPGTVLPSSPGLMEATRCDLHVLKPRFMVSVPIILDRVKRSVASLSGSQSDLSTKVKSIFGGNMEGIIVGGAPCSRETKSFMAHNGIRVFEGYASTESIGHGIADIPRSVSGASGTGYPMPGAFIKLIDWCEGGYFVDDSPNPRGELVIGSKCTQSYYGRPEETDESFYFQDGVRWWRSGDIAEMTPDGSFAIIDRKKCLVKLSRGVYVSLTKVETAMRLCPLVANVCVYGAPTADNLVALVVPDDRWLRASMQQLRRDGDASSESEPDEVYCDEQVTKMALDQIQSFLRAEGTFSNAEIPLRIKLCREAWTPQSGLVTAALKIRRKQIVEFYKDSIDKMYSSINMVRDKQSKINGRLIRSLSDVRYSDGENSVSSRPGAIPVMN